MTNKSDTQMETKERLGKIGSRPYWVFRLSILIRAVHQVGAAVFLTSYLLDEIPAIPTVYLLLVMLSGVVLLFTEWLRHRQIYREISGLSTLIKLILIGLAFHGFLPETPFVVAGFLLASISSHAPKQYRHRLLF